MCRSCVWGCASSSKGNTRAPKAPRLLAALQLALRATERRRCHFAATFTSGICGVQQQIEESAPLLIGPRLVAQDCDFTSGEHLFECLLVRAVVCEQHDAMKMRGLKRVELPLHALVVGGESAH